MVDAGDSKSPAARRAGSIPAPGTTSKAAHVQHGAAFLFSHSVGLLLSSWIVRESIAPSGHLWGHIWGHIFRKWGHIAQSPSRTLPWAWPGHLHYPARAHGPGLGLGSHAPTSGGTSARKRGHIPWSKRNALLEADKKFSFFLRVVFGPATFIGKSTDPRSARLTVRRGPCRCRRQGKAKRTRPLPCWLFFFPDSSGVQYGQVLEIIARIFAAKWGHILRAATRCKPRPSFFCAGTAGTAGTPHE